MQSIKGSWIRACLFAALCVAMGFTQAQASQAGDSPPRDAVALSSEQALAGTHCAIGEERFLPGDYYYCLASQSYGQGRYGYAQRFFHEAAAWGSKPAQFVLGTMALHGDQQPVDRALALAWMQLAAERHRADYQAAYQQLAETASPSERAAANKLLAQMMPVYGDGHAAARAEQRYHDGMQKLAQLSPNASYCLADMDQAGVNNSTPSMPNCPPVQSLVKLIDGVAGQVFDGWSGHARVGELQSMELRSQ